MQYTGFSTLKIDGAVLDTNGGASLDLGSVIRTAVVDATIVGSNRVLGWAQAPKQARLECEMFVSEKNQPTALCRHRGSHHHLYSRHGQVLSAVQRVAGGTAKIHPSG